MQQQPAAVSIPPGMIRDWTRRPLVASCAHVSIPPGMIRDMAWRGLTAAEVTFQSLQG